MFAMFLSRLLPLAAFALFAKGPAASPLPSDPPPPVAVVDYMKSIGQDAGFEHRKELFAAQWPGESYTGSAVQNTRLLAHLLRQRQQVLLPLPSERVDGCVAFYSNPEVQRFLSDAFARNAIKACIVTGTDTAADAIRKKLQEIYSRTTPADGKQFTAAEHKRIHDEAYRAAGCKEGESAKVWGWHVVNLVDVPKPVIKLAIEKFGPCTITGDGEASPPKPAPRR